jgi:hypothetical protein
MSTQGPFPTQPGQGKRLLGSLLLPLGVGFVLETSYQWTGISIIVGAAGLVVLGWKEYWMSNER